MPALERLYAHFRDAHLAAGTPRARAFREYRRAQGEALRRFALHEAIDRRMREGDPAIWGWPAWPAELRDPEQPAVIAFEAAHPDEIAFHEWLQWVASGQLAAAQARARELGMSIGLYGDYAVGVNVAGAETWANPRVYRTGAAVGAPPDPLALKGQDWGIPPQDPHALAAERYRPFRELIEANMRHYGALRVDHVMSLFRQWWVPEGASAGDGGYVHYPLEDLMSILALESVRQRCLVIGEDLGTVPDEVRHAMAAFAVYHYKVLLFEKEADGSFRAPDRYARRSIAAASTHDLPTLRGYWEGDDLALRDRLAALSRRGHAASRARRAGARPRAAAGGACRGRAGSRADIRSCDAIRRDTRRGRAMFSRGKHRRPRRVAARRPAGHERAGQCSRHAR